MGVWSKLIGLFLVIGWVLPAQATVIMRVFLTQTGGALPLGSSTPAQVFDPQGRLVTSLAPMERVQSQASGGQVTFGGV